MFKDKWIQTVVWAVIFLNLVVISQLFIIPRVNFIIEHFKEDRVALRESVGPRDMPNQYVQTYKVMNQVRKLTAGDSLLLLPPDNWEFGSPRSAVIQILYPRRVFFSGDLGFDNLIARAFTSKKAYVIFNKHWGINLCGKQPRRPLGKKGFGICRIGISSG